MRQPETTTTTTKHKKRKRDRITLTPRETIALTGIGLSATYRMLANGEIPHIRVGKRFVIPRVALLSWLKSIGAQPDNAG
jgi:excisionase family DNA binding protein